MKRSFAQSNGNYYGQQTGEIVEEENERLVDGLKDKITALKSLSIDIGHEVKEQNKYLRHMDDDFDSTQGFLQSTAGRLIKLSKAGHNRYILYLFLFSFFVFFVIYIILKLK